MEQSLKVGVLTVSDKGSRGEREDLSGPTIRELVGAISGEVVHYEIVPDEQDQIAAILRRWADQDQLDLVFTTGGTGLAPRDVTPEATLAVIDRVVPGLAEAMRAESLRKTPMGMLSRALAGVRGQTLVINLPGNPRAVRECLAAIMPALPHAVLTIKGLIGEHR